MAEETPQSKSPVTSPQSPVPPENKKVGSLVERLRSYESDVARLKNVHLDPVVPDKPLIPTVREVPKNPLNIAGKPEPHIEVQGTTAKAVEATNTIVSNVVKEDPQKAVDALHKETPIQQFRTIQSDVASVAQEKKSTVQEFIAAEQQKAIKKPAVVEDPKRGVYLLMLSGILIGGGLLALGGYFAIKYRPKPPAAIIIDQQNIVSNEKVKQITVAPGVNVVTYLLSAQKDTTGAKNEIVKLEFKEEGATEPFTAEEFATRFSPTIPTWLARAFNPVYLAGLHNGPNNWQPVMIFKVDSYENGYAGMLKWEETMADEFKDFYPQKTVRPVATTTASTSPSAPTQIIPTGFRDVIIKNKDVRVLEDASGRRLILYSFPDPTMLVITTDQAALEEAFARLTTSKFVR
jgi:hypothetical protein